MAERLSLARRHGRDVGQQVAVVQSSAASRADCVSPQIGPHLGRSDGGGGGFFEFHRTLQDGGLNLPKIADADVGLRSGAGSDKSGDGNRCEHSDETHNDHEFQERKARARISF